MILMAPTELRIGELARAADTTPPTIRYYEEIGLLPAPGRVGGQRRYSHDDIRLLTFIRHCRELGFPIEQVRSLASLMHDTDRSCGDARKVAETHLASLREKLLELHALERDIAGLIDASDLACVGGSGADCVVLHELAEPGGRRSRLMSGCQ